MIPKYHIVYYKNHPIRYENGIYKVGDLPTVYFLSMTDAIRKIDELERRNDEQFFNIKRLNDKTN